MIRGMGIMLNRCVRSFLVVAVSFIAISGIGLAAVQAEDKPAAQPNFSRPYDDVKMTIDEVIRIAQTMPGDSNTRARRDKLREVINPRFDFDEMAKRSLGAQWKKCTPEEQKQFVDVFSSLLAKTYLSRIETVKPGMVKMDNESVEYPKAIVRTTVINRGDEFPIEYKLLHEDGSWRVYDVVIENIGLIANYRNEFAGIIRKDSFPGLIRKLKEKADTEKSGA